MQTARNLILVLVVVILAGCADDSTGNSDPNRFASDAIVSEEVILGYAENRMPNGEMLECVYGRNSGSIDCNWDAYNKD